MGRIKPCCDYACKYAYKNILQYEELSGETGYTCPTMKIKGGLKKSVKIYSFGPLVRSKIILLLFQDTNV